MCEMQFGQAFSNSLTVVWIMVHVAWIQVLAWLGCSDISVVFKFYPWFKFYFPLFQTH